MGEVILLDDHVSQVNIDIRTARFLMRDYNRIDKGLRDCIEYYKSICDEKVIRVIGKFEPDDERLLLSIKKFIDDIANMMPGYREFIDGLHFPFKMSGDPEMEDTAYNTLATFQLLIMDVDANKLAMAGMMNKLKKQIEKGMAKKEPEYYI